MDPPIQYHSLVRILPRDIRPHSGRFWKHYLHVHLRSTLQYQPAENLTIY